MQEFSHDQVPKTKATLDDIYNNGNIVNLKENDKISIVSTNGEFVSIYDENGALRFSVNDISIDKQGIKSLYHYDKTNDNDFIQLKDLDKLKPYQKVVSSGSFDVSQVESDDITVIFSDTTNEVATLTIPTANASNEGKTITLVPYSREKGFSEPYFNTAGVTITGSRGRKPIKIKSIDNNWYEVL